MQHKGPVGDSPPKKSANTFQKQDVRSCVQQRMLGKKGLKKNQSKQEVLDKRVTGQPNVGLTNSSCAASKTRVTAGGGGKDPL